MRLKKYSRRVMFLVSFLMVFCFLQITVYANEYFDINNLTDQTSYVLGSEVTFSVTPRKYVSSKWSSWSNYPDYIYVRIYKDNETEPCKSSTYIYNIDGKSVGSVFNFMMPKAVGEERTVSFTPEAVGTYTVKFLWQNYDDKDSKKEPALTDQFTFTVKDAEEPATEAQSTKETENTADNTIENKTIDTKTTVVKKANTMTVKAKSKTIKVSLKTLKKKNVTIAAKKAFTVKKTVGKVTYKKVSGNKKIIISKAEKIMVKKGLKKGNYKIKVKVTAAGNKSYKTKSKTVALTIAVK